MAEKPSSGSSGPELIAVRVSEQQFAIDIMAVREIRGWTTSTPLAQAPSYVLGMINLRGVVLPVLDLGARLGFGPASPSASSVVIVVETGTQQVGLLVDAVCDILTADVALLQDVPDIGAGETRNFLRGVMTTEEGIVSLLSLDHVLGEVEALAA